tara:strand:- start:1188 stop:1436 length:249 start_codon:yes stop_codon:yes gene_type:complete
MAVQTAMPGSGEIAIEGTGSIDGIGERTDDVAATNVSLKLLILNVRGTWDTNPNASSGGSGPFAMSESYSARYGTGGGDGGP